MAAGVWRDAIGADGDAPSTSGHFVVCTGGEPLLQLDAALVDAFHAHGFEIAVPEGVAETGAETCSSATRTATALSK